LEVTDHMTTRMTVEDMFAQVAETVSTTEMTPTAAMKLTADVLSLMAVAWRPEDVDAAGMHAFVHGMLEASLARMATHPFAGGQVAN
jgi:hypothetical protein